MRHAGGQPDHSQHGHLHRRLFAAAPGVPHGLLLAVLEQERCGQGGQGELLQGHHRGQSGLQFADRVHPGAVRGQSVDAGQ